jgi:hypothetical protein
MRATARVSATEGGVTAGATRSPLSSMNCSITGSPKEAGSSLTTMLRLRCFVFAPLHSSEAERLSECN